MAINEKKRLTYTAIAVILVGLVTGFILGNSLLASPTTIIEQYNERTTTTETTTNVVHTHDGSTHSHTTTVTTEITETTPHYTFHQQTAIAQPGTTGGTPTAQGPGPNEVIMLGRAFEPPTITVSAGTKVTWSNLSAEEHSVTSNDDLFHRYIYAGESFSYTFNEPGTFNYYCEPHSGMTGTVIVE